MRISAEELRQIIKEELEGTLNERCQKGYRTHKKRKTKIMFGKRYRNCVKAKEGLDLQEGAALDKQILSRSDYMRGLLNFIEQNPGTTSDEMFNSDVANAIIPIGIRDRAITLWIKQLIKDGYITSKQYKLYPTGKASWKNHNVVSEEKEFPEKVHKKARYIQDKEGKDRDQAYAIAISMYEDGDLDEAKAYHWDEPDWFYGGGYGDESLEKKSKKGKRK